MADGVDWFASKLAPTRRGRGFGAAIGNLRGVAAVSDRRASGRLSRESPVGPYLTSSILAAAALALLAGGCATGPPATPPDQPGEASAVLECRALFASVDARVRAADVADAGTARIPGYPYLRIDRHLAAASVKPGPDQPNFEIWVDHLRALDIRARSYEIRNLPEDVDAPSERARHLGGEALLEELDRCGERLARADLDTFEARTTLLEQARVDDHYSMLMRTGGLYPFTSLPFNAGVKRLHAEMRGEFQKPLASLSITGRLTRYLPAPTSGALAPESLREILEAVDAAPFGVVPMDADLSRQLFDAFAPIFEIDVASDDDRIGTPAWRDDGLPTVDTTRPLVLRRLSYTRFEGRTLLQLNFSVWFPARTRDGALDILAGRLDGLTLRVTLSRDGQPLVYDSMHNCGCYHLFIPTDRLRSKPPPTGHEEPPLVPQRLAVTGGRLVVRLAHGTHYLQRLYYDPGPWSGVAYAFADDDGLRSLPVPAGGHRSLFDSRGLVKGTERGERWLFWPMGIASPGAMRQWGTHATAFVGRRHFDDPNLMERYFESMPP